MTTYLLSDAQLAQMRADVLRMLPGTAIIQAKTLVDDGGGAWSETWAAVASGTVACRVDPLPRDAQIAALGLAEGMKVNYMLTLPYNAPIDIGNRVSYGSDTYEIRYLSASHSWNVSVRAYAARAE